jgi:hypothetical protein
MRCLLGCFYWGTGVAGPSLLLLRRCWRGRRSVAFGPLMGLFERQKGHLACRRLKQRRPAAAAAGRAIGERRLLLGRGGGFADGGVPAPLPNGFAFPIPVAFLGRCFPGAPPPSNLLSSPTTKPAVPRRRPVHNGQQPLLSSSSSIFAFGLRCGPTADRTGRGVSSHFFFSSSAGLAQRAHSQGVAVMKDE